MPFSDQFVRAMNLHLIRFAPPHRTEGSATRRALISEMGFRLFERMQEGMVPHTGSVAEDPQLKSLRREVIRYIQRLEGATRPKTIGESETRAALTLARRLTRFVQEHGWRGDVLVRPRFPGCGILSAAEGDLLLGRTLFEVKNVERNFRLADIRQLLSYCALNASARQYSIDTVGLVNAQRGLYYMIDLDQLALATSGAGANELLAEITDYLTTESLSR